MSMTLVERVKKYSGDPMDEMSGLRKSDSGLPVNLCIDDIGAWKSVRHRFPRIKFQADHGNNMGGSVQIPMSIEDNPKILVSNPKHDLSAKELQAVYDFVKKWKDQLLRLANEDPSYSIFNFLADIQKGT